VNPTATQQMDTECSTADCAQLSYSSSSLYRFLLAPEFGYNGEAGVGIAVATNGISVYELADSYSPALLVYPTTISGWTHVAVVYTTGQPSLFINGVAVHTGVTSKKTRSYISGNGIGGSPFGYYTGSMTQLRIWNYNRASSDITTSMYNQLLGSEIGLVAYFAMREASGSYIYDSSTQGLQLRRQLPSSGVTWSTAYISDSLCNAMACASTVPSDCYTALGMAYNSTYQIPNGLITSNSASNTGLPYCGRLYTTTAKCTNYYWQPTTFTAGTSYLQIQLNYDDWFDCHPGWFHWLCHILLY
jgi:hypothetical protein